MKNSKILILAGVAVVAVLVGVFAFSSGSFLQGKLQANKVSASLSSVQPESQTLGAGMNHVNVGNFDIAANADIKLDELHFYFKGLSLPEVIDNASIEFEGIVLATVPGGSSKIIFKNVNFAIERGKKKTVGLWVDTRETINSPGNFHFLLRGIKYTDLLTAAVGSKGFAVKGPEMAVSTVDCSNGGC